MSYDIIFCARKEAALQAYIKDELTAPEWKNIKSIEIAEHMSRYFSKEIFEATYAHHAGMWV